MEENLFDLIPGLRHLDKEEADVVTDGLREYEEHIPKGYHIVEDLDGARYVRNQP